MAVLVSGNARIRTTPGVQEVLTTDPLWLCTKDGGCDCPSGQHYDGRQLTAQVFPVFYLAATGGLAGTVTEIYGHGLDEYCKPGPTPPPLAGCGDSCGN